MKLFKDFDVMRCHDWAPRHAFFPAIVEPKIDGVRGICIRWPGRKANWTVVSRNAKPIFHAENITGELESALRGAEIKHGVVFDGELHAGSLRETISIVKAPAPRSPKRLLFHAFDVLPLSLATNREIDALQLHERRDYLEELMNRIGGYARKISLWGRASDENKIKMHLDFALRNGYEGIVLKRPDSYYVRGYSYNWLKRKATYTAEFRVTGWQEGTKRLKGMLGAVLVTNHQTVKANITALRGSITASVGGGFSDLERITFWQKPKRILNRIITVEFKMITQNKKDTIFSLREPQFIAVRDYE